MEAKQKQSGRTPNFSAADRSLLVELVAVHKDIIENKKTDNATCKVSQVKCHLCMKI